MVPGCTDKPTDSSVDTQPGVNLRVSTTTPALLNNVNYFVLTVTADDMETIVVDSRYPEDNGNYILIDGQIITVAVVVPVGRDRRFVLEGFQAFAGAGEIEVVIYRAVQVLSVVPGRVVTADLALQPTVPMVRLSPRRVDIEAGDAVELDLQVANIQNLAVLDVTVSTSLADLTPHSAAPSEQVVAALGDNLVFEAGWINDATIFRVLVASDNDALIVNAAGFATLATIRLHSTAAIDTGAVLMETGVSLAVRTAARPEGMTIPIESIYRDRAGVWIEPLADRIITFADADLDQAVRNAIEHGSGPIYLSDVLFLDYLEMGEVQIEDLTGIENLLNLTYLDFSGSSTPPASLAPIAELANLSTLVLQANELVDISPLAGMVQLTDINFSYNNIVSLGSLSRMTSLRTLDISNNLVSDIAGLATVRELVWLDLSDNSLADITALARLTNLYYIDLSNNLIANVKPLVDNTGLGEGDTVNLTGNSDALWSDATQVAYINQLEERGVTVLLDR
jgi:hypothetical protein